MWYKVSQRPDRVTLWARCHTIGCSYLVRVALGDILRDCFKKHRGILQSLQPDKGLCSKAHFPSSLLLSSLSQKLGYSLKAEGNFPSGSTGVNVPTLRLNSHTVAQWSDRDRALLFFFSSFFFVSGKHQWGEWICMSGRLCQWAHWEGWVSGWSRRKQPSKCTVNNQSIRDYYRHTNPNQICPESFFWIFLFQTLCVFVFTRVCALRLGCFAAPHRLHTTLPQCGWEGFCEITRCRLFWCVISFLSGVLDLLRGGAGSRSSVVLLGEFTVSPSNLASLFTDSSRVRLFRESRSQIPS